MGQQHSPAPQRRLCVVCQEKAGHRMRPYGLHVNSIPSSGSATDVVLLSRRNVFIPGCKVGSGKILLSCSIRSTGVHVCAVCLVLVGVVSGVLIWRVMLDTQELYKCLLSCSIRTLGLCVCCVSGLGWSSVWGSHLEGDVGHTGTVQTPTVRKNLACREEP